MVAGAGSGIILRQYALLLQIGEWDKIRGVTGNWTVCEHPLLSGVSTVISISESNIRNTSCCVGFPFSLAFVCSDCSVDGLVRPCLNEGRKSEIGK